MFILALAEKYTKLRLERDQLPVDSDTRAVATLTLKGFRDAMTTVTLASNSEAEIKLRQENEELHERLKMVREQRDRYAKEIGQLTTRLKSTSLPPTRLTPRFPFPITPLGTNDPSKFILVAAGAYIGWAPFAGRDCDVYLDTSLGDIEMALVSPNGQFERITFDMIPSLMKVWADHSGEYYKKFYGGTQ